MAEIIHSSRKTLQRYNIQLTPELRSQIISAISHKKPTATFVEKQSCRTSVWDVQIPSYPKMRIVYDKIRKEIITVLHQHKKEGKRLDKKT